MKKIDRSYVRWARYAIQWAVLALTLTAGYKLYLFAGRVSSAVPPVVERPPLVDGFLPIGALMALKLWVSEGVFDPVHPAALVILLGAIAASSVLKKGFCGWICPVGTISEAVYKTGRRMFGRNFSLPKAIDYPLRSIKYTLLFFFTYVTATMSASAITAFLAQDYWKVADIKMLRFFTEMSSLTFWVLAGLFGVSLFIKNFWCRYLCPYGALLGILSFLSPLKITRSEEACVHCHKCTKNCPSYLPVEARVRLKSPECTGCLTCVSVCPAKGALDVSLTGRKPVRPEIYAALVLAVFFGIVAVAKVSGKWQSNVTHEEYQEIVPHIEKLDHP